MRYFTPFLLLLLLVAVLLRVEFILTIVYLLVAIRVLAHLWMRQAVRRLLARTPFPHDFPLPARVREKATVTAHLPKGFWGQRRRAAADPQLAAARPPADAFADAA